MPKSELVSSMERISERVVKKFLRESKLFTSTGTWAKILQDEHRMLKHRIEELEIRVKKLNNHGPTLLNSAKDGSEVTISTLTEPPRLSLRQIKKVRIDHGFSQEQFAQLLGISLFRYQTWENGRVAIPLEYEQKIREIRDLKGMELRTRMLNAGIFQPAGRVGVVQKKQAIPMAKKTVKPSIPESSSESISNVQTLSTTQLQEIRNSLKLTQKQFAEMLEITKGQYQSREAGLTVMSNEFIEKVRAIHLEKSKEIDIAKENQRYILPMSKEELKAMRVELELTQRSIGKMLGITKGQYQSREQGLTVMSNEFIEKVRALYLEKIKEINLVKESLRDIAPMSKEELKAIRIELELTQQGIAKMLEVAKNRYKGWEQGLAEIPGEFIEKARILATQKDEIVSPPPPELIAKFTELLDLDNIPATLSVEQIREIRTTLKLSRRQIAEKLEISESRYGNLEYGNVNIPPDLVKKILRLLAEKMSASLSTEQYAAWKQMIIEDPLPEQALLPKAMRRIRQNLNLTHLQMAEAIGVTRHRYKSWEYGDARPPLEFSWKIQKLNLDSRKRKGK